MTSFSINTLKIESTLNELLSKQEKLNEKIEELFRKAIVGQVPVAQLVMTNFNPSPEDLIMLSKVFERLASISKLSKEINEKIIVLTGLKSKTDWLYDSVGDTEKDLDNYLNTLQTDQLQ